MYKENFDSCILFTAINKNWPESEALTLKSSYRQRSKYHALVFLTKCDLNTRIKIKRWKNNFFSHASSIVCIVASLSLCEIRDQKHASL